MNSPINKVKNWLKEPVNKQDYIKSALVGLWAGIWIGGLCRIIYETPVELFSVVKFSILGAAVCAFLGLIFPKASRVIFLPFTFFNI